MHKTPSSQVKRRQIFFKKIHFFLCKNHRLNNFRSPNREEKFPYERKIETRKHAAESNSGCGQAFGVAAATSTWMAIYVTVNGREIFFAFVRRLRGVGAQP